MKIVVYWEKSDERGKAVGLIAPLQKFARQWLKDVVVTARSLTDSIAEEKQAFDVAVEAAFGAPKPKSRLRKHRAFGGQLVAVAQEDYE